MDEMTANGQQGGQESTAADAADAPQLTSLDALSEFEFQGEKYTPDQLHEIITGYKSLSDRQSSSASDERYLANIDVDIEAVLEKPSLAAKFKEIYPQKFHSILDRVLKSSGKTQDSQSPTNGQLPREFLDEFGQLKQGYQSLANQVHQYAVQAANAKIEAILPKLIEKYPMAIEDQVLARAEAFLSNGGKLTDAYWERLVRESHDVAQKKADAYYKRQLEGQLQKGKSGADAPAGGATPGMAPRKIKSFADAEKAMIEHLRGQGLT